MDPGQDETNEKLTQLESKIAGIYKTAVDEVQSKLDTYLSQFAEQDTVKRAQWEAGAITEEEYTSWREEQIMGSQHWADMRDVLSMDMVNANQLASSMINGYMPEVYAINHNYGTYEVEHGAMIGTSYTLYDRQTVERLITKDERLLPKVNPNTGADLRYNQQQFNSQILQGILQGESIPNIAKRVSLGVGASDMKAAVRNARTATTGAQNAGRCDSYKRAEDMGIEMMQVWMATLDARTRSSHVYLDGKKVKVGEKFKSQLGELRYPGDPNGKPGDVWGCRCTLIAEVKGIDYNLADVSQRNNRLGAMTYDEWKKAHMTEEEYREYLKSKEGEQGQETQAQGKQIKPYNIQRIRDLRDEYDTYDQEARDIYHKIHSLHGQDFYDAADEYHLLRGQADAIYSSLSPVDKKFWRMEGDDVENLPVKYLEGSLSEQEIIDKLSGGDKTRGSCASLALAYCANKQGLDITDFRGGDSQAAFARHGWDISDFPGVTSWEEKNTNDLKACNSLLSHVEDGKEYILSTGKHNAVIRRNSDSGSFEYLELQSRYAERNGWHSLSTQTLKDRFGCQKSHTLGGSKYEARSLLFDGAFSVDTPEMQAYLGYLNTKPGEQLKGKSGDIK